MHIYAGARQQDLTQIHQHLTEVRVQLAQYKESARRLEEENSMLKHQRLFVTPKVCECAPQFRTAHTILILVHNFDTSTYTVKNVMWPCCFGIYNTLISFSVCYVRVYYALFSCSVALHRDPKITVKIFKYLIFFIRMRCSVALHRAPQIIVNIFKYLNIFPLVCVVPLHCIALLRRIP